MDCAAVALALPTTVAAEVTAEESCPAAVTITPGVLTAAFCSVDTSEEAPDIVTSEIPFVVSAS